MDLNKYGPFGNIVLIAGALIATFSLLLLKMIGRVKQWTWMSVDSPPLLVTVGARMVAVALMAGIFITINERNYLFFGGAAVIFGCIGLFYINRFNHLRMLHVVQIPLVGPNGAQLADGRRRLQFKNVVVGKQGDINDEAKEHFKEARTKHAGLTLIEFMGGYGTPPNNPEALWDRELLANLSNQLTMYLVMIALFGVMVLYLGAFVIDIYNRTHA